MTLSGAFTVSHLKLATVTGGLMGISTAPAPPRVATKLLADFEEWVTRRGPQVAASSARRYRKYATDFARAHNPLRVTNAQLQEWRLSIEQVDGRTLHPSTINVKLASVRAFFAFLKDQGHRADNPTEGALPMATVPKRLPKPLPKAQVEALFDYVYALEPTEQILQDRAILEVLYGSGLRREELATLTLGQIIDVDRLRVIGKGDKERVTMMTPPEYTAIRAWVIYYLADRIAKQRREELLVALPDTLPEEKRQEMADESMFVDLRKRYPDAPIFYTQAGTPFSKHADPGHCVHRRVSPYLAKIGETDTNPHRLRHTFATDLLDGGVDLMVLQKMMGHGDIRTTMGYVEVRASNIQRARLAHPRMERR